MSFLPFAFFGYVLNAGSILVGKIQLQRDIPNPLVFTFYASILQVFILAFIPFGFTLDVPPYAQVAAILSGITFVIALYALVRGIKENETSVAGPVVGSLNPIFAFLLGFLFLNQTLTGQQFLAFFTIIAGTFLMTASLWLQKLGFEKKFLILLISGFLFGLSYVLLREAFLQTTFINGLIISRISSVIFALSFLLFPTLRSQILKFNLSTAGTSLNTTVIFIIGQSMGAVSNLLIAYAVSLTNPALVNSFFGVQYLTILIVAILLAGKNPHLLDETLTKGVILQKLVGVVILSYGLFLLTR